MLRSPSMTSGILKKDIDELWRSLLNNSWFRVIKDVIVLAVNNLDESDLPQV